MTQRYTALFGAALAVAGAAVATDHLTHRRPATPSIAAPQAAPAPAPASLTAQPSVPAQPVVSPVDASQGTLGTDIVEFAPCAANMDGFMAESSQPVQPPHTAQPMASATPPESVKPAEPTPAAAAAASVESVAPIQAAPAAQSASATPGGEAEIIEFAPCAAAF